jgi:hypothetical protein
MNRLKTLFHKLLQCLLQPLQSAVTVLFFLHLLKSKSRVSSDVCLSVCLSGADKPTSSCRWVESYKNNKESSVYEPIAPLAEFSCFYARSITAVLRKLFVALKQLICWNAVVICTLFFSIWRDAALRAVCKGMNWKDTSNVSELFSKGLIPTSEFVWKV